MKTALEVSVETEFHVSCKLRQNRCRLRFALAPLCATQANCKRQQKSPYLKLKCQE